MSGSRNQVRGPSSALSSFLRERGIRPPANSTFQRIVPAATAAAATAAATAAAASATDDQPQPEATNDATHADAQQLNGGVLTVPVTLSMNATTTTSAVSATSGAAVAASPSVPAATSKRAPAKSKGKKNKKDADDDDDDNFDDPNPLAPRSKHTKKRQRSDQNNNDGNNSARADPASKLVRFCKRCQRRFVPMTLVEVGSVSTTQMVSADSDMCTACLTIGAPPKRAMPKIKKNRKQMEVMAVSGEVQSIMSLRDMCIKLIADNIEDVEQFGEIPYSSKRRISKIISRQRRLDNRTAQLFVGADEDTVELFDCTRIDEDGFISIAMLCPNVKTLNLSLCGRMTDTALKQLAESCPHIESLTLKGPFLPTDAGFSALIAATGPNLKSLVLEHAAKLSYQSISVLKDTALNLATLSLTTCARVGDEAIRIIAGMNTLRQVELNGLGQGVTVESLLHLVNSLGPHLTTLSLDGYELLDDTVVEQIATVCKSLTHLSLAECPRISSDGMIKCLSKFNTTAPEGLISLSLNRNVLLNDAVIHAVCNQIGHTLQHLSINGLDEITENAVKDLAQKCTPRLITLDISWIRCINDDVFVKMVQSASSLKRIKVFGCHALSRGVMEVVWRNSSGQVIEIQGNEFD
eukprot:jgi/Hompol1/7071/HPOL_005175-RA